MLTTTAGKIFLSPERGHIETESFRSYQTLSAGIQQPENKRPFGPLTVLNDETLAGGKSVRLSFEEDTLLLLLPVVGAIATKRDGHEVDLVQAGEVLLFHQPAGSSLVISNPYEEEQVNYLQLQLACKTSSQSNANRWPFDLNESKNRLVEIFPAITANGFFLKGSMGKFSGRKEAAYPLTSAGHGVMAFVLQGAFEVENRLLEAKDGLALWNTKSIELEALSNDAILLLLEVKLQGSL
ncbi:MAG TPA: hypothetical protein VFT06_00120 [Flavisolibacter sp.]|nr:hypothetical protein [Flavisolibacter sp.]